MAIDMKAVMDKLQKRIFTTETDFQLALAMEIERMYPEAEVRCEFPPNYESRVEPQSGRIHLDILVRHEGETIPIELKYRTKKLDLVGVDNYGFNLMEQGAHDEGSYGFWRDVCRISEFKGNIKSCHRGYAIFLTNDLWYKNPSYEGCKTNYKDFDLNKISITKRKGCVGAKDKVLQEVPEIQAGWYSLTDITTEIHTQNSVFEYYIAEI